MGEGYQYEAVIRIDAFLDCDSLQRLIARLLMHGGIAVHPDGHESDVCRFRLSSPSFALERDFRDYVSHVLTDSKIKFRFV